MGIYGLTYSLYHPRGESAVLGVIDGESKEDEVVTKAGTLLESVEVSCPERG